jgi:hypothetical protein
MFGETVIGAGLDRKNLESICRAAMTIATPTPEKTHSLFLASQFRKAHMPSLIYLNVPYCWLWIS